MKMPLVSSAALALCLAGCGSHATQTQNDTENSVQNGAEDLGNSAGNAMIAVTEAVTPTPTGQEFADKAAKSDAFEIAAAKLAEKQSGSDDIKSFAKEMIKDHTESTAKIKAAAEKASPQIKPDPTLGDDDNKKLADLGSKTGVAFDKAYIAGQVDAHKDALELMQAYAKNGDTLSLKSAAGAITPFVQHHLDMARALDQ